MTVVVADAEARAQQIRGEGDGERNRIFADAFNRDPEFFAWLESHGHSALAGDSKAITHAVAHSCTMKAAIVARDERETGDRMLLNLGHTFGHAFEAAAGFSANSTSRMNAFGPVPALPACPMIGSVDRCAFISSKPNCTALYPSGPSAVFT